MEFGASTQISVLGGSTAVAHIEIDVEKYPGDLATVCFCSSAVSGTFGCQNGQGRNFNLLMGYVSWCGMISLFFSDSPASI